MKCTLACLAFAVFFAVCLAQSNHKVWGRVSSLDTLVYAENVTKSSIWWTVREAIIDYPPTGVIVDRPITSIRAYDGNTVGHGANVTIVAGGVNQTSARIVLRSQSGYSIDFRVEIYSAACRIFY